MAEPLHDRLPPLLTPDIRCDRETCSFSGLRIYPGHGIFFVRGDSKGFKFVNRKVKSLFTQRLNPRKLAWTVCAPGSNRTWLAVCLRDV